MDLKDRQKYEGISKTILENVGGKDNISMLSHCVTRLRINVKDQSLVNETAIREIKGLIGVQWSGEQLQIIIGTRDIEVAYQSFCEVAGMQDAKNNIVDENLGDEKHDFKYYIQYFASFFQPVIPALIATALIGCVMTLLSTFGLVSTESTTYQILKAVGDTAMTFLPLLIAVSVAQKVGCNIFVALALVACTVNPTITSLLNSGDKVTLFGIPVTTITYTNQVIPAILAVLCYAFLEKKIKKILPNALQIFSSTIAVFITIVLTFLVFGPLGYYVGSVMATVLNFINSLAPWLVSGIVGALCPFLIMFGMHWAIVPVAFQNIAMLGYDALLTPGFLVYNINMGVVGIAIGLRCKNKEAKDIALSAGVSGLAGISEPSLFGVCLKYKMAMVAVVVGSFIGGCYLGVTGVSSTTWAPALLAIASYFGETQAQMINCCIGCLIGAVVTFVIAFVFGTKGED
jgi:PTS system beta-glucosides-specific IIC component